MLRVFTILIFIFLSLPDLSFAVTKKTYDFVVGVNGDFKAAKTAAANAASSGNRFYIFFPDGNYDIGSLTGDINQKTTFSTSKVSFIGQSTDNTVIYNKSIGEGIDTTATLYFSNTDNMYLQDLTIYNKANYGNTETYSVTGRHVAVQQQGDKFIYKNVKLLSTQDTYYTKGKKRTYWENGEIHGTTDYICGDGDIFFNQCRLYNLKQSAMTAPSTTTQWGYVFSGCTIDGDVNDYTFTLGRSWNTAKAVYINTTMKKLPSAAGWGDPMNSNPQVFSEYNSKTASGTSVDLSSRRTSYTKGVTVTLNPVLSASQAAEYTVANVLSGSDNWQPDKLAQQISAPTITQDGNTIKWNANDSALCWVVFKGGKYLANVSTNSYDASAVAVGETITVRAANEMGGLGLSSNALVKGSAVQYNLSVSVAQGQGAISPESGKYNANQSLALTATPAVGWLFDHWSGDVTGSTNPTSLVMNSAKSVSAYFTKDTRQYYAITKEVTFGGSLVQNPKGDTLVEGTAVSFTVTPLTGWVFNGWSGDHTGTDATWTITSLSQDISIKASFVPADKFTYQAETGTLNDAVLESKNTGFTGESYVNFSANSGSSVEIPVYVDNAGTVEVTITYANGSGTTRQLNVSVNGTVQVVSLDFEATADWTTWGTTTVTLSLGQGVNTITFATVNTADGPNIDKITLTPDPTQIRQSQLFAFNYSYNPSSRTLHIQSSDTENLRVGIYTINGKEILSTIDKSEISLHALPDGVYFLKVSQKGKTRSGLIYLW
jgi:uncharacterized repeat protein (TIGR02543 family)